METKFLNGELKTFFQENKENFESQLLNQADIVREKINDILSRRY